MGTSFGRTIGNNPGRAPGRPAGAYPGNAFELEDTSPGFQQAFAEMRAANQDSGIARRDPLSSLVGQAPRRDKGGFGDVLATVLAVAADATDPEGRGAYTKNLAGQWAQRGNAYEKALQSFQERQRVADLPGMTEREMMAYMADPKAWGSHMADAATSRYQAATLNPGDQRYLGEGNGVYQAPTRGQQYASDLGLEPGSEAYDTAIRDQEMGAQGPTAFANGQSMENLKAGNSRMLENARQLGRLRLEGVRQGGRSELEDQRQSGRLKLRGTPLPPRLGAASGAPTVPTAKNANGDTVYLRNGRWVDAQGRAVQ